MMRKIAFRSWLKDKKEMLYDFGTLDNNCLSDDDRATVTQFTGLFDKHGNPVYEGDLLKHPVGVVAEIKYENDVASFVAVYTANDDMEMNHLDREIIKKCEVVGNIFENPELLEDEE